jgi:hypothetical protein
MDQVDEIAIQRQVELICNDFEERWSDQAKLDFESFLARVDDSQRDPLLRELLAVDVELRIKAGQQVDPDDYRQLGSQVVVVIGQLLKEHDANKTTRSTADHNSALNDANHTRSITINIDDPNSTLAPDSSPVDVSELPERIGRHRVHRILGKGNFGLV